MNRFIEVVLAVVLVGTALDFGGVQPLTYSLMEIVLFGALLAVMVQETWHGNLDLPVPVWPLLFVAWVGFEIVPLPAGLVRALEPARFRVPPATVLHEPAWLTLSTDPHATLLTWIRLLAYLAAFTIAVRVFDSKKRRSLLVRVLIGIGLFEAVYGSVQYLTGWQKIFTYSKKFYTGMASGTYINHNHFGGVLELTLPFLVGSILYYFQIWQENRRRGASRRDQSSASAGFQVLVYMFLLVVMLVGLLFSRSRGAILGAILSLLFVALLAQLRVRRKTWLLGLFAFLAVSVGYGLWIGLDPVLSRFEELGLGSQSFSTGSRLSFSRDALGIIRDYRWTGTGLGTFATTFRHYQTGWVTYFVDHAHNDFVEFACETGLVGAALLFLPILYLLVKMAITFLRDSRRYRPAVLLGCVGSIFAILIHSATDFNLQVPANALIVAVVLGIGYKAACIEKREESSSQDPVRERVRTAHGRH
jgi:putative inorganic carbon (HCO3(-)) transporter